MRTGPFPPGACGQPGALRRCSSHKGLPCVPTAQEHTKLENGFKTPWDKELQAILIPAVLSGEPVKGDASVSTGTLEKPLYTVVPVVVVLLANTGLQRLEVGVGALQKTRRAHIWSRALEEKLGSCHEANCSRRTSVLPSPLRQLLVE